LGVISNVGMISPIQNTCIKKASLSTNNVHTISPITSSVILDI
jgi:hypothetical protein